MSETPKEAARRLMASKLCAGYQPEALHVYHDAEGNALHWRMRLKHPQTGDKVIRPMRLMDGGYDLKEPEYPNGKPLYNLHLLARDTESTVWLVEGEKCADALASLGVLATTSGSADSMRSANWDALAGRDVVIWPDHDEPGLHYADDAQARLRSIGATVKRVDIASLDLPRHGDCVDWLQAFEQQHGGKASSADLYALPLLEAEPGPQERATSDYFGVGNTAPLSQAENRTDDDAIARLAALPPLEYDRTRKDCAKALGVRPATLDKLVQQARQDDAQDDGPFADVEPWPEPVNPAQLLDEIASSIMRFIVLDKHQAQAAALWVSACWFVDVIQTAPIALINAPERACGKTQLLTVLGRLAPRTAQASGISPSVLFRMIETYQPTLFIDEVETILKDNEDLRGLINAGHTRDSAYVWRSVAKGDDFEPKRFRVWGMKAVAGINAIKLAETVTSRSIVFELRRKKHDEHVQRLRHAEPELFETLAAKLARFADDYAAQVSEARPALPDQLGDREQDNWEPLLQLAAVAGGHWPETSLRAALTLSGATQSAQPSANELLSDIQDIFEGKAVTRISSTDLINALCDDSEKSWASYNRGKQLTPRQLSTKLKDYGITSMNLRFGYGDVRKGYERSQFEDAFSRYLTPSENGVFAATPLQPASNKAQNVADTKPPAATRYLTATPEPAPDKGCSGVADKSTAADNQQNVMRI